MGFDVTVPKIASDTNCRFGSRAPKTTLSFDNTLEGVKKLTESYYAHICGFLTRKGYSQRKRPIEKSLDRFHRSWASFVLGSSVYVTLLELTYDNMHRVLPGKLSQASIFRVLLGAPFYRHDWLIDCLCIWSQMLNCRCYVTPISYPETWFFFLAWPAPSLDYVVGHSGISSPSLIQLGVASPCPKQRHCYPVWHNCIPKMRAKAELLFGQSQILYNVSTYRAWIWQICV